MAIWGAFAVLLGGGFAAISPAYAGDPAGQPDPGAALVETAGVEAAPTEVPPADLKVPEVDVEVAPAGDEITDPSPARNAGDDDLAPVTLEDVVSDSDGVDAPAARLAAAASTTGLMFAKTANLATAAVGDLITYAIPVSNASSAAIDDLTVVDELPEGVEFVSATNGGDHTDGIVSWKPGQLPAHDDLLLEVVVRVLDQAADTTVVNRANVNGTGIQGVPNDTECSDDPGWACATTTITPLGPVAPGAGLAFTKTVDRKFASVGDEITYTLTAKNDGAHLTQVALKDTLPEHVEFVSASDGGVYADGVITWPETYLNTGDSVSHTLVVKVRRDAAGSTVTNCATADCTEIRSGDTVPVWFCTDYPHICAAAVPPAPGSPPADPADDPIPGLPGWFSTNFFFLYPGPQGDGLPDDINAFPADVQAMIHDVANRYHGAVPLPHYSDCAATVIAPLTAGLTFTKTVNLASASVGDEITYTLTAKNDGAHLTQVALKDTLPEHVEFVSASDGGVYADGVITWLEAYLNAGDSVSRTLVVKVLPDAAGSTLTNCATADCRDMRPENDFTVPLSFCQSYLEICVDANPPEPGEPLPDAADDPIPGLPAWFRLNFFSLYPGPQGDGLPDDINAFPADIQAMIHDVANRYYEAVVLPHYSDCATTVIAPLTAGLTFAKTVNLASASVGDLLTYAIPVSNSGNVTIDNLVVIDQLPNGVQFVSATNGGDHTNGIISWKLGQLPAHTDLLLEVVVRVLDQAANTTVVNRANVNGTGIQGVPNDTECTNDPGWACAATAIAAVHKATPPATEGNPPTGNDGDDEPGSKLPVTGSSAAGAAALAALLLGTGTLLVVRSRRSRTRFEG